MTLARSEEEDQVTPLSYISLSKFFSVFFCFLNDEVENVCDGGERDSFLSAGMQQQGGKQGEGERGNW